MPRQIHGGENASESFEADLGIQVEPALCVRVIPSTD